MSLATRPSQEEEPSASAACCVRAITAAAVVVELANTPETAFDKPKGLLVRSEATILDADVVIATLDYATNQSKITVYLILQHRSQSRI
jgi:hypothetical protein